jgi:DNA replication and repair protein RecF
MLSPGNNLIVGPNASGKTSLLEAVGYLGRGRSFRGATTRDLIRRGASGFVITGEARVGKRTVRLGVGNGSKGLEVRVAGETQQSAAALAEALPLQVIDPDVHDLVAAGPEHRRRYIDWMTFHVEPGYLGQWRRYRRALKQRNAALREGAVRPALRSWDQELAQSGMEVDAARGRLLALLAPLLRPLGEDLLGSPVSFDYQRGWGGGRTLADALEEGHERDRAMASTQSGPHRADLRIDYDERRARKRVSRGQQKLLASAMVLAAIAVVQEHLERPLLLLLDDPAAELDGASLKRLMAGISELGPQVLATALDAGTPLFAEPPCVFHVEQGIVRARD